MQIRKYSSLAILILANIFILIQFYLSNWDTVQVLLLFWMESAIIGLFTILKMIVAKFRLRGLKIQNEFPPLLFVVPFFIVHFGTFMTGHLLFILMLGGSGISIAPLIPLAIGTIPLLLSHGFSFASNFLLKKEYDGLKIDRIMLMPYRRIVVMHLTLLLGFMLSAPIIFLFAANIAADAYSHMKEHEMP